MTYFSRINTVKRNDATVDIEMEVRNEDSSFSRKRVFNYDDGVTVEQIQTDLVALGKQYKTIIDLETTLKQFEGIEIQI